MLIRTFEFFLINILFGARRISILILSVVLFVMFVVILVERPEFRAVGIIFWKKCKLRKVLSFSEILHYFAYSHVRVFLINILFRARRISILILSVVLFVMFVVILVERPEFRAVGVIFWKKCKLRKVLSLSEILDYFAYSHVRIFSINILFGARRILILILSVLLFVMFAVNSIFLKTFNPFFQRIYHAENTRYFVKQFYSNRFFVHLSCKTTLLKQILHKNIAFSKPYNSKNTELYK